MPESYLYLETPNLSKEIEKSKLLKELEIISIDDDILSSLIINN